MTELIKIVLQRIHLKDQLHKTAIASRTRVRKIPQNHQSISRKWKEKSLKTQSCIDQSLIMPNNIGAKRCNLCLTEKYHILTSSANFINKTSELVSKYHHERNFHPVGYKQSHRLVIKATISNYGNISVFNKNKCIWIMW